MSSSIPSSSSASESGLDVRVVDRPDVAVADHAHALLASALPAEERDDRFEGWPGEAAGFVAVLATRANVPVGLLSGARPGADAARPALDALVDESASAAVGGPADVLQTMMEALTPSLVNDRGHGEPFEVEIWARPARPWHETVVGAMALHPYRSLHQMRCSLPVGASLPDIQPLPTVAYTDADFEALRTINNRAFASHPDQGSQTAASLSATIAEPWFRAEGVRLHHREGRLAGFCWTKIHPSPPAATALGEIYVIGVDPDFHGQGLGVPMTAAGLDWLAAQGLTTGMLYVEGDNVPAIRTYERLGFSVLRTDRAWIWTPGAAR